MFIISNAEKLKNTEVGLWKEKTKTKIKYTNVLNIEINKCAALKKKTKNAHVYTKHKINLTGSHSNL